MNIEHTAQYTELFSDYLANGGQLPAEFEQIEGFTELFKLFYCDKEIGFETEELFLIKLKTKASLFIPLYKQRIDNEVQAITNAINPTKTYYDKTTNIVNAGKQRGTSTDLPIAVGGNITPSSITESDAFTNNDTGESTRTESGTTINEALLIIDKLNDRIRPITLNLLNEFKTCFMLVY